MNYLLGLAIVLLGVSALILAITLQKMAQQIVQMNERLLVLLGVRDGGDAVGRALIASAKLPRKDLPGISAEKESEKPQTGVHMTVGAM